MIDRAIALLEHAYNVDNNAENNKCHNCNVKFAKMKCSGECNGLFLFCSTKCHKSDWNMKGSLHRQFCSIEGKRTLEDYWADKGKAKRKDYEESSPVLKKAPTKQEYKEKKYLRKRREALKQVSPGHSSQTLPERASQWKMLLHDPKNPVSSVRFDMVMRLLRSSEVFLNELAQGATFDQIMKWAMASKLFKNMILDNGQFWYLFLKNNTRRYNLSGIMHTDQSLFQYYNFNKDADYKSFGKRLIKTQLEAQMVAMFRHLMQNEAGVNVILNNLTIQELFNYYRISPLIWALLHEANQFWYFVAKRFRADLDYHIDLTNYNFKINYRPLVSKLIPSVKYYLEISPDFEMTSAIGKFGKKFEITTKDGTQNSILSQMESKLWDWLPEFVDPNWVVVYWYWKDSGNHGDSEILEYFLMDQTAYEMPNHIETNRDTQTFTLVLSLSYAPPSVEIDVEIPSNIRPAVKGGEIITPNLDLNDLQQPDFSRRRFDWPVIWDYYDDDGNLLTFSEQEIQLQKYRLKISFAFSDGDHDVEPIYLMDITQNPYFEILKRWKHMGFVYGGFGSTISFEIEIERYLE